MITTANFKLIIDIISYRLTLDLHVIKYKSAGQWIRRVGHNSESAFFAFFSISL